MFSLPPVKIRIVTASLEQDILLTVYFVVSQSTNTQDSSILVTTETSLNRKSPKAGEHHIFTLEGTGSIKVQHVLPHKNLVNT